MNYKCRNEGHMAMMKFRILANYSTGNKIENHIIDHVA